MHSDNLHKLADAIRIGSHGRTKAIGSYGDNDGSVCALGAAGVAARLDPLVLNIDDLADVYPCLHGIAVPHPQLNNPPGVFIYCDTGAHVISTIIPHLNDIHGWTFGQIADWLDDLADQLYPQEVRHELQPA